MMFKKTLVIYGIGCLLATSAGLSWADWVESPDMSVVRPAPDKFAIQPQNPPAFTWAKFVSKVPPSLYILELSQNGKVIATYTTKRNFYLPSKAMAAGTYSWRVRPQITGVTAENWSDARSFVISSTDSQVFEVPDDAVLKSALLKRARPRELPVDFVPYSKWSAAMKAARGNVLTNLQNTVKAQVSILKPVSDSMFPITTLTTSATRVQYINDINKAVSNIGVQLESSALLYRITNDAQYLAIALARGDELAALDPNGMSSYANNDQCTRTIMLTLAKAADFLGADLDAGRKKVWMTSIERRVQPMYADLISGNYRLDEQPFDSHGTVAQGYLAVISMLTLGDIPAADAWFDFSFRAYVNSIYVWSGPEGGYSNGTAYGMYSTDYALQLWQPIANATGVNLFKKPWSTGFSRYLAHFLPPGAPGHVFGDQREYGLYLNYLKGFMSRIATPNALWYVKNLAGTERELTVLEAAFPLPVDTVSEAPVPPPNAALYPSIGWVAMHSDLSNRARTSVYFKSSPYGSYNHSQADQNTLVIDSGGRRLLVEAGYQDYFDSPLTRRWYRETKAHNGITYNGGIGQLSDGNFENLARKGKITAFKIDPVTKIDYAEGDATLAYGTAKVSSAIRRVWYLRDKDVVLVQDKLVAPNPLTFEWNLHAAAPIVQESVTSVKITNVDRTLCVQNLSLDGGNYTKLPGEPNPQRFEDHGAFVKTTALTNAEFIVVLDIGCKRPMVKLTSGVNRSVIIGDQAPIPLTN